MVTATPVTPQTIRELIDSRSANNGKRVFLVDPVSGRELNFATTRSHALSVARYLQARGVQPGASVAFAMSNGIDCVLCLLGILYGGYRATAVNLISGAQTTGYVLDHAEARIVLTQAQHLPLLREALGTTGSTAATELVTIDDDWWSAQPQVPADTCMSTTPVEPETDALLMYTSGTTGRPKGVVLTHRNLLAAGRNPTLAHELTADDRVLCVLPIYHINGFCTTVMAPLYSGSAVVLPEKFSARQFWSWMREQHCSWFSVVPTHISYLLHRANEDQAAGFPHDPRGLEQIRFCRSASAPLAPDMQRGFEQLFGIPVVETMGLTETAGQILSNPMPPGVRKIGSAGVAVGGEVMIADEQQREVPPCTEAEILFRGDNVMQRYLKKPEATRECVTAEGWLRTGDLGRMDEDGYVFVTGRLKELIIKGGENIAPREVDEALYQHPDVVEAAAFPCPCQDYGQRIEAAVTLSTDSAITEDELMALCSRLLGDFKRPDRIHLLDELPKGPSGKIQRRKLTDLLAGSTASWTLRDTQR